MQDFFILGCSRSGTTLLASLLNSHNSIFLPTETWWLPSAQTLGLSRVNNKYFRYVLLNRIRRSMSDGDDSTKAAFNKFISQTFLNGSYDQLFRAYANAMKEEFDVSCFGEKTPAHTTFMNELNTVYPDFSKVILLRDPRDIVFSYFDAWFELSEESLYQILKTIKVYLRNILTKATGRIYWLKYEDLTLNPKKELEGLLGFLEVDLVYDLSPSRSATTTPEGIHKNLTKNVFINSGKYHQLPEKYIQIIEAAMPSEFEELGYALEYNGNSYKLEGFFRDLEKEVDRIMGDTSTSKLSKNWRVNYFEIAKETARILKSKVLNIE